MGRRGERITTPSASVDVERRAVEPAAAEEGREDVDGAVAGVAVVARTRVRRTVRKRAERVEQLVCADERRAAAVADRQVAVRAQVHDRVRRTTADRRAARPGPAHVVSADGTVVVDEVLLVRLGELEGRRGEAVRDPLEAPVERDEAGSRVGKPREAQVEEPEPRVASRELEEVEARGFRGIFPPPPGVDVRDVGRETGRELAEAILTVGRDRVDHVDLRPAQPVPEPIGLRHVVSAPANRGDGRLGRRRESERRSCRDHSQDPAHADTVPAVRENGLMADDVDRLYELPLDEFTSARNELAKRTGDASIKELKKPSVSAWAVNQLARRREVDLRRLLRAGEQLEKAQKDAVRGRGQAEFEQARRDERDALRRLRAGAADLLRDGGHPASDQSLERVAKTLRAGAATEEGRTTLREGRLSDDLEPQGFDAFAALAGKLPPPKKRAPKPPARRPNAAQRRRAEKAQEAADAARADADDADAQVKKAERQLDKLRRDAARAAERAERLAEKARELEADAAGLDPSKMRRCAAGPRWAARWCVLSRARITADTNAPCVLPSHHPSHPGDEDSFWNEFLAGPDQRSVAPTHCGAQ